MIAGYDRPAFSWSCIGLPYVDEQKNPVAELVGRSNLYLLTDIDSLEDGNRELRRSLNRTVKLLQEHPTAEALQTLHASTVDRFRKATRKRFVAGIGGPIIEQITNAELVRDESFERYETARVRHVQGEREHQHRARLVQRCERERNHQQERRDAEGDLHREHAQK